MVNVIRILCMSFLLIGCAANLPIGLSEVESGSSIGKKIEGVVRATDGTEIDLGNTDKETVILVFAQDTCITCSEEADEISTRIEELGGLPSNVEIVTFLVGLTGEFALDDASDWKQNHNAQWTVVVQEGNKNLFQEYFPGSISIPAFIIQRDGRIFFQHIGALGIDELEKQVEGLKNE